MIITRRRRAAHGIAAAALVLASLAIVSSAAAQTTMSTPDPAVVERFDAVAATIAGLDLPRGTANSLNSKLSSARRSYERRQPCTAANQLQALLNEASALRNRFPAASEAVFAEATALRDDVIASAHPSERCANPALGAAPQVDVLAADNQGLSAVVSFAPPVLTSVVDGGETWTQVSIPGIDSVAGPPGKPAVPSWQALVAVPDEAEAVLRGVRTRGARSLTLNLYPFQRQAADQTPGDDVIDEPFPPVETFMDPPFAKDEAAYARPGAAPPNPCAVAVLDKIRDLTVAQVECTVGTYDPVADRLVLFDSVRFDLAFEGGKGTFVTSQSLSPFERSPLALGGSTLNASVVPRFVEALDFTILPCFGEELLILTHPNFRPAADDLAAWKNDKGISTSVFEVGAGTVRATGAQIDDFIEDRYDNCVVRPSYVLLLGDSEWVPPAAVQDSTMPDSCGNCGDATTGSDLRYAIYPQNLFDIFPDFGVGRMPVDTLAEAQRVVDKTIEYEQSPPFLGFASGAPFYTTATNASYFQCCRTGGLAGRTMRSFVETSELVRGAVTGAGYTVERIYNTDTAYQSDPVADPTPRRYYNGTALPAPLAPASGFPWEGDTNDIINAFNDGRFLVLHRDHGGSTSWGDPSFSTSSFSSLTNGEMLPVVYSVNCASGYWDRETDTGGATESFMEQLLLRDGGGMVGGLGDNRNSPTWANSALTRGFYDATWPGTDPNFGGNSSTRRLGDILNWGKVYLLGQVGVAQTAGEVLLDAVVGQWVMWHAFGDPTLEMWTGNPYRLVLPLEFALETGEGGFLIRYAIDGAELTAIQEGPEGGLRPIGRATVAGGVAEMSFLVEPDPEAPIRLSASRQDSASVLLAGGSGGGQPDLKVSGLSVEATPSLVPGQDLSSVLTMTVENVGTAAAPGTVLADGSVSGSPGYMIDIVLSGDTTVPPGFATVPLPEGVAYAEDGLLQGGRVSRTPEVPAGGSANLPIGPPISTDVGGIVPTQTPAGTYHLCVRIDPGAAVAESDETNNVTCIPVRVLSPPDR